MEIKIELNSMLTALSLCLDFSSEGLNRHHQRVTYISSALAEEMGLSDEEKSLVVTASIVHDVGVSTWQEKQKLSEFEVDKPWDHCRSGHELVSKVDFLRSAADVILCHHDHFEGDNNSGFYGGKIPLAARIIHLADRVDVLLKNNVHILKQQNSVMQSVKKLAGSVFDPELVTAFENFARRESFWLGLTFPFSLQKHIDTCKTPVIGISEKEMKQTAEMFASVIDRKSPFTYRHSRSVTGVSVLLSEASGFSQEELFLMELSGLLHDLGKLSIPDEILEKPDSLTTEEFAVIRQHTFYTYRILQESGAPSPIPEWAAYHHERLNGKGYPFHLEAPQIPKGSRIMSVADVFTALHEDRPYRPGMSRKNIEEIMHMMVLNGSLDGELTKLLFEIYDKVDKLFN